MKPSTFLSLLTFDDRCFLCSSPLGEEKFVCASCLEELKPSPEEGNFFVPYLDGYRTFTRYEGRAREILKLVKFDGIKHLATEVGKRAAPLLREYLKSLKPDLTTFVPSNPLRYWFWRGFDPTEEMLKAAAVSYKRVIKRSFRWRKPLARARNREERIKLVKGVFNLERRFAELLEGRRVLVVDDVLTSGATASAVAYLLKSVGVKEVYLFAFFRAVSDQ